MIKRIVPIALIGASIFSLNACKSGGDFKKTENGVLYKIVKDEKGTSPQVGDVISMHMIAKYKDDKTDTTLFDSRKMNNNVPIEIPLPAPAFKGDFVEALMKLSAGDSAIIRIAVDSLKKQQGMQLPEFMKGGQHLEYTVTMLSVKSQQQMKQEQDKHATEQKSKDEQILQDYFKTNNIQPSKTASGLYYLIEQPGSGANPVQGQAVTVNYTGKTLDGKVFDSNTDPAMGHAEPFTFNVGQGMVIPGWDEGVLLLRKGSKAKLFIPSGLAYGSMSPNPSAIPNDAILMFDIEVLKIEEGTQPQMNAQPQVQ
ncbi:MAG TPA: FKBP-type peptidyl-prolyl cis-trans isomerase [Flavipsychrobacter sp.]|nr:FKBP-type peptidyl-prolyl cis-trans isomerase [Flavipsychrobacter sp.]